MDPDEAREQQAIHEAVETALELDPGQVLTGWILLYEVVDANGPGHAGHLYGPREMTTWRALGLVEWASRFSLAPDDDD